MYSPIGEAAIAYRDLSICYRTGRRPSDALWKALDDARRPLAEYIAQREAPKGLKERSRESEKS